MLINDIIYRAYATAGSSYFDTNDCSLCNGKCVAGDYPGVSHCYGTQYDVEHATAPPATGNNYQKKLGPQQAPPEFQATAPQIPMSAPHPAIKGKVPAVKSDKSGKQTIGTGPSGTDFPSPPPPPPSTDNTKKPGKDPVPAGDVFTKFFQPMFDSVCGKGGQKIPFLCDSPAYFGITIMVVIFLVVALLTMTGRRRRGRLF